jgi:hypothetical protein
MYIPFGGVESTTEQREANLHDVLRVACSYTCSSHWPSCESVCITVFNGVGVSEAERERE